jgi:hypothetical protein
MSDQDRGPDQMAEEHGKWMLEMMEADARERRSKDPLLEAVRRAFQEQANNE